MICCLSGITRTSASMCCGARGMFASLKKSTAHLPAAIEDLGAQSGEAEWKQIEECFRDVAVKLKRSLALKAEFMRCSIMDYSQNLSDADKIEIVRQIFQQLKDERDEKRGLQYGARRPARRSAG